MQSQTVFTRAMFKRAARRATDEGKKQRIAAAEKTFLFITNEQRYEEVRQRAKNNIDRWKQEKQETKSDTDPRNYVNVIDEDWGVVTGEITRIHGEIFAVLNMANAGLPGDGWYTGSENSEADMLRRTDICRTMTDEVAGARRKVPYYKQAVSDLINGQNGVVLLRKEPPQVCFHNKEMGFLDDDIFPFYELRSAAVDCRQQEEKEFDEKEMRKRIKAQFQTLKDNGIRHVVLGAFGCDDFKNPAEKVAELYKEQLESPKFQGAFDQVYFAISTTTREEEENFQAFSETLGNKKIELKEQTPFNRALNTILESKLDDITPKMVKELYATTTSDEHKKYEKQEEDEYEASGNDYVPSGSDYVATVICQLKLASSKQKKNQILRDAVKKCEYLEILNRLFVLAREIEDLNQSRHPVWDYIRGFGFFTWKPINTKTWRDTMGEIRQHAYKKLEEESVLMETEGDLAEKKALLKWAETAEIFAAHRNNSIFAKAWGDTKTVEKIKLIPRLK